MLIRAKLVVLLLVAIPLATPAPGQTPLVDDFAEQVAFISWEPSAAAGYYVVYVLEDGAEQARRAGYTGGLSMAIATTAMTMVDASVVAYSVAGEYVASTSVKEWPNGNGEPPSEPDFVGDYDGYYKDFSTFCQAEFGGVHEPLVYYHFGENLTFLHVDESHKDYDEDTFWLYESLNSAAIAFSTSLPAWSWIEYSEDMTFSASTDTTDRCYYVHMHHVKGLSPNTTYNYRLGVMDERAPHTASYSAPSTFTTVTWDAGTMVEVPGALSGPPFTLSTANRRYILTEDIVADAAGLIVGAAGVVIDLNGHSLLYDNGSPGGGDGISNSGYHGGLNIFNGTITQGQTQTAATSDAGNSGSNPIYSNASTLVRGVVAVWGGDQLSGINLTGSAYSSTAEYNILVDTGIGISDRHYSPKAIYSVSAAGAHNNPTRFNLVKRIRGWGVWSRYGVNVGNEVYVDSYAPNGYGVIAGVDRVTERNKVFGTGYNLVALPWAFESHSTGTTITNNFVHLQGDEPYTPDGETHAGSGVKGIRLTQYGQPRRDLDNYVISYNTIAVYGRNGTTRVVGMELASDWQALNNVVHNNYVRAGRIDDVAPWGPRWGSGQPASCIVTHGGDSPEPLIYYDNIFESNVSSVYHGDYYTTGSNHWFVDCEFIKYGDKADYSTIKIGWGDRTTYKHRYIDPTFGLDAAVGSVEWLGTGERWYWAGTSLYIEARDGSDNSLIAATEITANSTATGHAASNFEDNFLTDGDGLVRLHLIENTYHPTGSPAHTDHVLSLAGFEPALVDTITGFDWGDLPNAESPLTVYFTPEPD